MRRAGALAALTYSGGLRARHTLGVCCVPRVHHLSLQQTLHGSIRLVHTSDTVTEAATTTSNNNTSNSSNIHLQPAGRTRFARSTLPAAVVQGEHATPTRLTARQFCVLMFNISNDQRRMPTLAQRRIALQRLASVSLPHVVGLSGRDVVQCVRTLAMLRASPSLDLVHDTARWLAVHGASLNSESLIQALYALLQLRYATLSGIVTSVHDCLLRDLDEGSWPSLCMALGVVLHCLPSVRQDSPLWATATRLRDAVERTEASLIATQEKGLQQGIRQLCPEMVGLLAGLSVAANALRTHAGQDQEKLRGWRSLATRAWFAVMCDVVENNSSDANNTAKDSELLQEQVTSETNTPAESKGTSALDRLGMEDLLTLTKVSCGGPQACGGWLHDDTQGDKEAMTSSTKNTPDDKKKEVKLSVEAIRHRLCDAVTTRVRAVMMTQAVLPPDWHVPLAELCLSGETAMLLRALWAETIEAAVRARLQPREDADRTATVTTATGLLQLYVNLSNNNTISTQEESSNTTRVPHGARDMRPLQLAHCVPDYVIDCLCAAIERSEKTGEADEWDATTVDCVLYYFQRDAALHGYAVRLLNLYLAMLQRRAQQTRVPHGSSSNNGNHDKTGGEAAATVSTAIQPEDILPLLHPELVSETQSILTQAAVVQLTQLAAGGLERWSVTQILHFLEQLCQMPMDDDTPSNNNSSNSCIVTGVLRKAALTLTKYVNSASGAQLAALLRCYGMTGVREDRFCAAVVERVHGLLPEITVHELSEILAGLTALEYADVKPFLDAAPLILSELPTVTSGTDVVRLLGAYAMQRVPNFRLYFALAERLASLAPSMSLMELVAGQVALLRVEVTHTGLTTCLVQRVQEVMAHSTSGADVRSADVLTPHNALQVLHVLSRVIYQGAAAHTNDSIQASEEGDEAAMTTMKTLCQALAEYIVDAQDRPNSSTTSEQTELALETVVEVMLSLARVHREAQGALFDRLALRVMGSLPSATPTLMLDIVEAYALAGRQGGNDTTELLTTIAARFIAEKDKVPATHIAAMLAAFARLGVRQDHLFVEMIPRMRLVAIYGGAQDVTNVVTAYAAAKVWHYHLFTKLAERALQVRVMFTAPLLVRLLEAYATVGMRQTRLLHEFATSELIHFLPGLTPDVVVRVVECYATLETKETALLGAVAEYAALRLQRFRPTEAARLLTAMQQLGFVAPAELRAAYARFQPRVYEDVVGVGAAQDKDVDASVTPASKDAATDLQTDA